MTEKRLIRGIIDLDNVVSDWLGWYIEQIGIDPESEGLRTGKLTDMYPDIHVDTLEKLVADRRGYTDTIPVEYAPYSLRELLKVDNVRIFYLSAAVSSAENARRLWMEMHGVPLNHPQVEGLLHARTSDEEPGHEHEKIEWIEKHGAEYDFIVDDNLAFLDAAWTVGIEYRYSFFQYWNSEDVNHTTVYGWPDLLNNLISDFGLRLDLQK